MKKALETEVHGIEALLPERAEPAGPYP